MAETSRGRNVLRSRLDALSRDLEKLRKDTAGLASEANDAAGHQYRDAVETARLLAERSIALAQDAAAQAGGTVLDAAHDAEDWTFQRAAAMRNVVREQPLQSLLVTIGIGALIGALVSRR
jgi:ElaB/YqjD/DUF883 family membrane-anchored ribosome-binding protein